MVQNTLEENIMDKAISTRGLRGKGVMESVGRRRKRLRNKTPQKYQNSR